MANELQNKLNEILLDKNTNLLPEHLKAGVTCLGVEGNLESGSSEAAPVKLFATVEEMNADTEPQIGDTGMIINNAKFDGAYKYNEYDSVKLPRFADMTVNSATSITFNTNYNTPINLNTLTPILDNIIATDDLLNGSGALTIFQQNNDLYAGFARRDNAHNLGLFNSVNRGTVMKNDAFFTIGNASDTNGAFMRYYKIDLENSTFEKQTDVSGELITGGSLPVYYFSFYHTTFPIMYSEGYDEMSGESTGYQYGWTELIFNYDGSNYNSGVTLTKNDEILFEIKEWEEYIPDIYNEALHSIDPDTKGITFEKQSFKDKGLIFPDGINLAEDMNGQTPFYPYADANDVVDAGLLVNGTTFYYYFEVSYWYAFGKMMNFTVTTPSGYVYNTASNFKCYGNGETQIWITDYAENNTKLSAYDTTISKLTLQSQSM